MTSASGTGRRPDIDIFAEARKALDERPSISATVRVHVDDGVVWLTGTARRASERREAEDVVRHVRGVERVVNKIISTETPGGGEFEPDEKS